MHDDFVISWEVQNHIIQARLLLCKFNIISSSSIPRDINKVAHILVKWTSSHNNIEGFTPMYVLPQHFFATVCNES